MLPPILFLDTETTDVENGRIIQLAYKKRSGNDIIVEYYKPPVPIKIEAMAVHHITEKHVAEKPPFSQSKQYGELDTLLQDAIVVAHNAKFDIGILKNEGLTANQSICTMKIAQAMYDYPMYKLQYLRYLWDIDENNISAHDAGGDVVVLEKVFEHMLGEYARLHAVSEQESIDAFLAISHRPVLLRRAPFGKYKGETFEEIKTKDLGYLQWMASLPDKEEDFVYTVRHHLMPESTPAGGAPASIPPSKKPL